MDKNIIIGMGTGRCGTNSLSDLLNKQNGCISTHEAPPLLPYERNMDKFDSFCRTIEGRNSKVVADVALYHLWYVQDFIDEYGDSVKFVSIKRDMKQTVDSYMKKVPDPHNHWKIGAETSHPWGSYYPRYNIEDKRMCIEQYWKEYYELSEEYEQLFENFRVINTEDLNTSEGVGELLEFCGFDDPILDVGIQSNKLISE